MKKIRGECPFLEKFMVAADSYEIFKFTGSNFKDEERSLNTILKYFSKYFTKEQLKENMKKYNLQRMLNTVKRYFAKEYGYTGMDIELSNIYQNSINSYIYNDKVNPAFIHIDELFESTVMGFLLAMFKWSKDFQNLEVYGECFKYVLFLMNDVCIFGEMQGIDANNALMDTIAGDIQILQLAEDCYWTIVVFSLAHEVAHAYLATIGRKYTEKHIEKEEYDADIIAYRIVLKIIMEERRTETILEEYTYLAPMIYMDFFDLYYYTDRILYKTFFHDPEHPTPVKRKNRLFAIANGDDYEFDTVKGNQLYNCFLDVYIEFKEQLLMKMENGKLNKILWTEKREDLAMNRKKAMEYNDRLKEELEQLALEYSLEESMGTYMVDNCITVIPEDARKGMVFLGREAASYKMGNIKIDLKKAIIAGLEFIASVSKPESVFNYIQLIIVSVFFIEKSMKQKLDKMDAHIVYLLHKNNTYNIGIEEEKFINEVREWYKQNEEKDVTKEMVVKVINNLYEMKIVDLNNGYIYLKEYVWITVK